jgi:hypothetical protein
MKINDYLSRSMNWKPTGDAEFPYSSTIDGKSVRVRLNDFPADSLYTLLVAGAEFDFDDWPSSWVKTATRKTAKTNSIPRGRLAKAI